MLKIITNPPMGIYGGDINVCHAYFLVLLDVYARYNTLFSNKEVICPFYSFNAFGKKGDQLVPKSTLDKELFNNLDTNTEKYIAGSTNRQYLNLSSLEKLTDNDSVLVRAVQNDFSKLEELGFLIISGKETYLNCPKIKSKFDLKSRLDEIKSYPERVQVELERLIDENTDEPVKITKDTRYSPQNPVGGQNIAPLFCLANLWDHKYPNSEFTITGSYSILTKYIFLRFLCRTALEGNPGMNEIFVWSKVAPENGIDNWDLKDLCSDPYKTDMLRYAFVSAHSLSKQKVALEKSRLKGGRKFVYLVDNLRTVLSPAEVLLSESEYPEYHENMRSFKFNKSIDWLSEQFKELKREVSAIQQAHSFADNKKRLSQKYAALAKLAEPIIPATIQKGRHHVPA